MNSSAGAATQICAQQPPDPGAPKAAHRWPRWVGCLWPPAFRSSQSSEQGVTRSRLVLELFVILCLCLCYYFLVRNFALGVENNDTNFWVFTACGTTNYHLDGVHDVWKGRLSGMLLTGSLFDLIIGEDSYQAGQYAMIFGWYQAFWLLVLMLTVLVAVRESLLVNLGIFAGLIYNFTPAAGFYFYPWDLPATVFLTLAVLLHERGHRVLMLAAIATGCFFKETVLVGAILCLFCREWKWRWRILSFVGLAAFYILGKRYLLNSLQTNTAVLAWGGKMINATSLTQLLSPYILMRNLKLFLLSLTPQMLFANAGTLLAVLVVGWERRFRPYIWLIVAFVAGHYLWWGASGIWRGVLEFSWGGLGEVRIFMQVLPLSCLVLSECARGQIRHSAEAAKSVLGKGKPVREHSAWACRKSDRGLVLMAVVMMLFSSVAVVWAYAALLRSWNPKHEASAMVELKNRAEQGEISAQYWLGNYYSNARNCAEAEFWLRAAAEKGHIGAQLALGSGYLQGECTEQSYEASIPWFRKVVTQGSQESRYYFGLDYIVEAIGVKRVQFDRFQYLAWLGPAALATAGLATLAGFVRKRKPIPDPALCVILVLAIGALGWRWRCGGVVTLWQSAIACDQNYYRACNDLGYALFKMGRLNEAIVNYQKAVELQPDLAQAHYNLGFTLLQNKQPDRAIAHLQRAVELQPDLADAHYNLGNALLQRKQLDQAIIHFQRVVELQPNDPIAHYNLGNGFIRKKQLDYAIRQYQEALRLKPDFAEARANLTTALGLKNAAAKQPAPSIKP